MRKDESRVWEWAKHTRNVYGGRRRVNQGVRRNQKRALRTVNVGGAKEYGEAIVKKI